MQGAHTTYNSLFELIRYESGKKPMQSDGGCKSVSGGPSDKSVNIPVALTSSSFGSVKLCYDNSNSNRSYIQLIAMNQNCPAGSQEQMQPVDDCSTL